MSSLFMVSPSPDPVVSPHPPVAQQPDPSTSIPLERGRDLYLHRWTHPDPVGGVLMLHGKGDYGGRFAELGACLNQIGWSCYAPDMLGFGRSRGPRCWIWGFDRVLKDLEIVQHTLQPQIWGGYSTGALWSIEYALAHPEQVTGLILISPALRIDHYFTPLKRAALPVLNRLLPQLVVIRRYTPSRVTSIPDRQQELADDPWVAGTTRIRFVAELSRSGRRCIEKADQLDLPILLLYTSKDQIVDPAGVVEFAEALQRGHSRLTLMEFPESEHDLLHDVDDVEVRQIISTWIQENFPQGAHV